MLVIIRYMYALTAGLLVAQFNNHLAKGNNISYISGIGLYFVNSLMKFESILHLLLDMQIDSILLGTWIKFHENHDLSG